MDDIRLLKLLRRDPDAGMQKLMDMYSGLLYAVAKSKLADRACLSTDVEDVVADTFSEFYLELDKYDPELSSIRSYLCIIARNNAVDLLRKNCEAMNSVRVDDEEEVLQIADDYLIETDLIDEELRRETAAAIKSLGEPDTEIIFRKFYLAQSSKAISEKLGLSVANVDTRTHRAITKLRMILGGKNEKGYKKGN